MKFSQICKIYQKIININNKILLENFQNIVQNRQLINEAIYRNEKFQKFYKDILNKQENKITYTSKILERFFTHSWIITRWLRKNQPSTHILNISILDFSNKDEIKEHLKYWIQDFSKQPIDIQNNYINEKYEKLKNAKALFQHFKDNNIDSIMYLNKNFTIQDLKHQFGHYIDWLQDDSKQIYIKQGDIDIFKEDLEIMNLFQNSFNVNDFIINEISKKSQFERYLTEACDQLKELKEYKFNNITNKQFVKNIINDLFINENDSSKQKYINRILKITPNILFNNLGILMIIYYNLFGLNITTIKNHIFGYFSKKEKN